MSLSERMLGLQRGANPQRLATAAVHLARMRHEEGHPVEAIMLMDWLLSNQSLATVMSPSAVYSLS